MVTGFDNRDHDDGSDLESAEAPYKITYDGNTMVSVPWDVYVSALWLIYSKDIQLAAVAWRDKAGTDADLRIVAGFVSASDKRVVRRTWRRDGSTELETIAAAHTALERFANKHDGELTRLDIRGDTRTMEQVIAAVAMIELGLTEAEA